MNEQQLESFKKTAIENLKRDGYLVPIVVLEDREGQLKFIILDYKNNEEKDAVFGILGMELRSGKYKGFLHISEAYVVMRDNNEDTNLDGFVVSEQPDRKEAITLVIKNDDGNGFMEIVPFRKIGKKIIIEHKSIQRQKTNSGNVGGNLWEMWR